MRRSSRLCIVVALLISLANASTVLAWSYKEHILFARVAVMRLLNDPTTPEPMKLWLRDASGGQVFANAGEAEEFFMKVHIGLTPKGYRGLSYWVYQPDIRAQYDKATVKIQPFGVHERVLHFFEVEHFVTGDETKREYKHDLSNKPKLENIPHDMTDPRFIQGGMLPFRIEQCYAELTKAIRENRLNGSTLEQQDGKTAVYWAAYLAHYLADNTQPQHASMDYKNQSYFANKTRSPNIHAEVEYRMCDDEVNEFPSLRREYWPMFAKQIEEFEQPFRAADLWQDSVQVSLQSYDAMPLIGLAAMHSTRQQGTPQHPEGPAQAINTEEFFHFRGPYMGRDMSVMEMKAIQTAWAVQRIQHYFLQAWKEAMPAR